MRYALLLTLAIASLSAGMAQPQPSFDANDKVAIWDALERDPTALRYATKELQNDREFVLQAILRNASSYCWASNALQDDEEITLAAVNQSGYYLYYASARLQNNKEIVLAAIETSGIDVLQFASKDLQKELDYNG